MSLGLSDSDYGASSHNLRRLAELGRQNPIASENSGVTLIPFVNLFALGFSAPP